MREDAGAAVTVILAELLYLYPDALFFSMKIPSRCFTSTLLPFLIASCY
jgi:hypothetical protein